jgi:hypothetical protein
MAGLAGLLALGWWLGFGNLGQTQAGVLSKCFHRCKTDKHAPCIEGEDGFGEVGGTWYWLHSPDEEKRVVMGLFNIYCIRCHGSNGRGIWDIPGVPDFTNSRWQASRSDADLVRIIIEGRGAVMPQFRGTLSLEEAWGMARYLRSFVEGAGTPRPDFGPPKKKP